MSKSRLPDHRRPDGEPVNFRVTASANLELNERKAPILSGTPDHSPFRVFVFQEFSVSFWNEKRRSPALRSINLVPTPVKCYTHKIYLYITPRHRESPTYGAQFRLTTCKIPFKCLFLVQILEKPSSSGLSSYHASGLVYGNFQATRGGARPPPRFV